MPWGRLDDSLYDHPKLDALPEDRRLAGVGLWARAISWCNRFLTDGHVPRSRIEKLDGTLELADQLVTAGLFEADATGYQIHDFLDFNDSRAVILERRAKEAHRKAEWRAKKGKEPRPGGTDNGTANGIGPDVPPSVPPSVPAGHDAGPVSRDSRGRSARESRPDPSRPDPSRPTESLRGGSSRAAPAKRADIQALLDRGWPKVTRAQRKVLTEIADRHRRGDDDDGSWFAAGAIAATTPEQDPLAMAIEADRLWQASQRKRADQEESEWEATKAREREEASALPWLAGVGK